jgi:hypothetical protein
LGGLKIAEFMIPTAPYRRRDSRWYLEAAERGERTKIVVEPSLFTKVFESVSIGTSPSPYSIQIQSHIQLTKRDSCVANSIGGSIGAVSGSRRVAIACA